MGLGAYEPIGIQQGIAVCGTPRDVPSPRAGLDSWHYLTCFCQFIALSVGSKEVRVFIALRMKDREGPNQAVHPPKFMAMFTSSGLLFSPVDTLCPWKQTEALGSVEFGLCQYPSEVDLQICEGSVRMSVSG